MIPELLLPLWPYAVLLLAVSALGGFLRSATFKGMVGEWWVKRALRRLDAGSYTAVHDVTLLLEDGSTTQIDHVVVSRFGVFVIETKNMGGWIFGTERDAQWTQKMFKKTFKFQNPLRQNWRHVKAMEERLGVPAAWLRPVVVFTGDAEFKKGQPKGVVLLGELVEWVRSHGEQVMTLDEANDVLNRIEEGRLAPGRETARLHVENLRARKTAKE